MIALAPIADGDRGTAAHAAMAEPPGSCAACAPPTPSRSPSAPPSSASRRRRRPSPRLGGGATIAAAAASGPAADAGLFAFQRPGGARLPARGRGPSRCPAAIPPSPPGSSAGARGRGTSWPTRTRSRPSPPTSRPAARLRVQRPLAGVARGHVSARGAAARRHVPAAHRRGARAREQLGRPSLAGPRLVFHRAGPPGRRSGCSTSARAGSGCCAPSVGSCCSTPPSTAASCSTSAPPRPARSCGSAHPCAAHHPRPPPLRHHADRPPRRGPRSGPPPPPDRLPAPPAAPLRPTPAGGRLDDAVDHRARAGSGLRHAAAPPHGHAR